MPPTRTAVSTVPGAAASCRSGSRNGGRGRRAATTLVEGNHATGRVGIDGTPWDTNLYYSSGLHAWEQEVYGLQYGHRRRQWQAWPGGHTRNPSIAANDPDHARYLFQRGIVVFPDAGPRRPSDPRGLRQGGHQRGRQGGQHGATAPTATARTTTAPAAMWTNSRSTAKRPSRSTGTPATWPAM